MQVLSIIRQISDRPKMYLAEPSIDCLESYIAGWMHNGGEQESFEFLNGFQRWVAQKYEIETNQSWGDIILFFSFDRHSAAELALSLFQEYATENGYTE